MEKSKKIYQTCMLIIVVAIVTFLVTTAWLYNKTGVQPNNSATTQIFDSDFTKKIYSLKQIMNSEYLSEIKEEDLIEGAIKGYVDGLGDQYTQYFTKKEMDEFKTETSGNYVGIGIYMIQNAKDNTIVVLTPIENSPAEEAGLLTGDIIKKVDDVEYTGEDLEKAALYIKGEQGTKVKLEIERNKEILTFEVERKKIDLYPVKAEILDNKIGYISIESFDQDCSKEFKDKYKELHKQGIRGLIIDLRNNGGGIVDEVLEIADYALEKGKTIMTAKGKADKEKVEKSKQDPIIHVPIVVLVNESSASASEILAAALQENGKATLVGETTFGKGLIQELISLSDGSGIKITIAEYYTPNNHKINKQGVTPNIEIELPKEVINFKKERESDTQLKEAMKVLNQF